MSVDIGPQKDVCTESLYGFPATRFWFDLGLDYSRCEYNHSINQCNREVKCLSSRGPVLEIVRQPTHVGRTHLTSFGELDLPRDH